jgi:hypothetical protein
MAEKGEKVEKEQEDKKEKKEGKRVSGKRGIQIVSLILILVLMAIVLIVVQVPYITTDVISEKVPVEKCTQTDIPFASNFKTGLNYDTASKIYSSDGQALYRYSKLKGYLYANIRNTGEEKGIYCINAEAYLIENFTNDENSLASFQNLIAQDSDRVEIIDNWNSNRYTYPVCTEKSIRPIDTGVISLWDSSLLSKDVQEQYDLDNVYILFTIVPPTSEKCGVEEVEKEVEQEVTRYCNAWKHLVGMC